MGRIKPLFIKRAAEELLKAYKDRFKDDFDNNKTVVQELIDSGVFASPSKRMRNKVAGSLVRAVRPTHNPIYKAAPKTPLRRRPMRRFSQY